MRMISRSIIRVAVTGLLLITLAWASVANAAPKKDPSDSVGKSDLNRDGTVDYEDLSLFSSQYLELNVDGVDWCAFYDAVGGDDDVYGRTPDFYLKHFGALLNYINHEFGCDRSDVNKDGVVDLEDLRIFSNKYLELNWETVDWCEFYSATGTGARFDLKPTDYYLEYFTILLSVIHDHYGCQDINPSMLELKNSPRDLTRLTMDVLNTGNYYFSDPRVGSIFVYDSFRNLIGEIKNLDKPLGVAIDSPGYLLVGNNGRNNIEVYDPANGDRLAVFGQGLVEMPTSITIGPGGDIYVTDSRAHRVWVFDPSYVHVRTIGLPGTEEGQLRFPTDTTILSRDTGTGLVDEVYVADQRNNRIQVFDTQGTFIRTITPPTVLKSWCLERGMFCPSITTGAFIKLQALDMDAAGHLHVLDSYDAMVHILDPVSGALIESYGGYGRGVGLMQVPDDLLLNGWGEALITDNNSDIVEVFPVP